MILQYSQMAQQFENILNELADVLYFLLEVKPASVAEMSLKDKKVKRKKVYLHELQKNNKSLQTNNVLLLL